MILRNIRTFLNHLPIKWKMVLWSSLMLFLLFAAYNIAQYLAVNQWMIKQENTSIQRNMAELQNYFQENQAESDEQKMHNTRSFLEKINEKNQMIRILDNQGNPLITVSNRLPENWVPPQRAEQEVLLSIWYRQDHLLVMRSPFVYKGVHGTIEIVKDLETFDQLSDMIFIVMIIGGIGGVILSGVGGLMIVRQLLRPVQSLTETIQNVQRKGLRERVQHSDTNDELTHLAKLFNDMMNQLETSFNQQKQFVEDASHELRTPIAIIKGHLSLLHRWGKSDPQVLEKSLTVTLQEFSRLEGIVQELLELTRAEAELPVTQLVSVHPVELIQKTVNRFSVLHPDVSFETDFTLIGDSHIRIVPNQLEQIVLILLDNAVKYSSNRKRIRIEGSSHAGIVQIRVIDQGIGIPPDELQHVFNRFYRVDKARSRERGGTGLGLAIAKRLVDRNQGEISIQSTEDQGTCVLLSFHLDNKR